MTTLSCPGCGASFTQGHPSAIYCNRRCAVLASQRRWRKKPEVKEKERAYRIKTKDRTSKYGKNYRQNNPKREIEKMWRAKGLHDFTYADFEKLYEEQDGLCAICGEWFPLGGKGLRPDHCHKTGAIRGLVCHGCNMGLGLLGDNALSVRVALLYLEEAEARVA